MVSKLLHQQVVVEEGRKKTTARVSCCAERESNPRRVEIITRMATTQVTTTPSALTATAITRHHQAPVMIDAAPSSSSHWQLYLKLELKLHFEGRYHYYHGLRNMQRYSARNHVGISGFSSPPVDPFGKTGLTSTLTAQGQAVRPSPRNSSSICTTSDRMLFSWVPRVTKRWLNHSSLHHKSLTVGDWSRLLL